MKIRNNEREIERERPRGRDVGEEDLESKERAMQANVGDRGK